eukprot:706275-Pyramimonas_sp.AAC.1
MSILVLRLPPVFSRAHSLSFRCLAMRALARQIACTASTISGDTQKCRTANVKPACLIPRKPYSNPASIE